MDDTGERRPGPSTADRLFVVLECCAAANRTLSLAELAATTGLPKSTLHRTCWKLVELGALEERPHGFRVGVRLFALGSMNPELRRLRAISVPFLSELCAQTGWMANLAVRSGDEALLVEELHSADPRIPPKMIGATMPLHATATGKSLLAHAGAEEIVALAGTAGLRAFTRSTIVRPSVLVEHLARVRARGVALGSQEWRQGAAGVGAPVVRDGEVVAAIALVGPPDPATMRHLTERVRRAALRLGATLSQHPREPSVA